MAGLLIVLIHSSINKIWFVSQGLIFVWLLAIHFFVIAWVCELRLTLSFHLQARVSSLLFAIWQRLFFLFTHVQVYFILTTVPLSSLFYSLQRRGSPFGRVHGVPEDLDGILSAVP